jgi:WD40 repeat protein
VWKYDQLTLETTLVGSKAPVATVISPSPILLVSGSEHIRVWDIESASVATDYDEHLRGVTALASHDFSQVLSGSSDGTVKLWDLRTRRSVANFSEHIQGINSLRLLDEYSFVSASTD